MLSMQEFIFPAIPTRVIFGRGTLGKVATEIERLGHSKALILSTPFQANDAEKLAKSLGNICVGTFTQAAMHTPIEVTEAALTAFKQAKADCVVSLGGGSTIGLGKAIALRTNVDQIVIPTTYAGSEMTDILGETSDGQKTTRRDAAIRPETVIYDTELTLTLPLKMTMTSALNAIAHVVEGLYAPDRNPIVTLMAKEAMQAFKQGLPTLLTDPQNLEARSQTQYAGWLCSTVLGYVSMALHHKLCHTLGGSFNTPHADTHAILLPHTAGFNAVAVPELLQSVTDTFGDSVGGGLWDFAQQIEAPLRLKDLGLSEANLDKAAQIATQNPYDNPRKFDINDIRQLLQNAWEGTRPAN